MNEIERKDRETDRFLYITHTKGYSIPAVFNVWYKAKDAGELNFIIKWFSKDAASVHGQKDLQVGEWFTVTLEFLPNVGWSREFVTLKKYKKLVKEMFSDLNTIEKKEDT